MATLEQIAQQIRFGLHQLKARNGHHEFESLCRHLARARICSNILPATGPVSFGGDQGKDFESFRTYLAKGLGADATFVGLTSEIVVAFGCTMTSGRNFNSKLKRDVTTIAKTGEPCDIHYFCSEDIAVSQRHAIQEWTKENFGIHLEVYDRQAISELLCASDTFWIAGHYLQVPTSLFEIAAEVYQAPSLPAGFVERPDLSEKIKDMLLHVTTAAGSLGRCVLYGLPGGGKSTIAAAVANDAQVRSHFRDGILWATLGQEPNHLELLAGWLQALGDSEDQPRSMEAATNKLRSCLRNRRCLLVVDDAWDGAHVEPFLAGGEGCRLLLTTRDLLVAQIAGVEIMVEVGTLTHDQAMRLVSRRLGRTLDSAETEDVERIVVLLGYLPLALELVTALVASGGASWKQVRASVDAETVRLTTLEPPGLDEVAETLQKRLSLQISFNLTLRRMPERIQRAFAWLGVLQDDATITCATAATLWQESEAEAYYILRYLRGKSLLLVGTEPATFRMHDLLHDAAKLLLVSSQEVRSGVKGLGMELPDAHTTLLARYCPLTIDGSRAWHTVSDDGYIYEHLTWHLQRAARIDEMQALFRGAAGHAWYQRRDRLGQTAGYVSDVFRAWRAVRESPEPVLFKGGSEMRYVLIASSLNSVARQIPLSLLIALVQHGVWRVEKAIDYASKFQNPQERNRALLALASFVDDVNRANLLPELASLGKGNISNPVAHVEKPRRQESGTIIDIEEAYSVIASAESYGMIIDEEEMEKVYLSLRHLPKKQAHDLVGRMMDSVDQLYGDDKDRILAAIGPYATEEQLMEALQRDSENAAALAPWLSSSQLLRAGVKCVGSLHGLARRRVIEALVPLLSPDLLQEIVPFAGRLNDANEREEAALSLALVYAGMKAWEPAISLGISVGKLNHLVKAVAPAVPLAWVRRLLAEAGEKLDLTSRGLLSMNLPQAEIELLAAELLGEARELRQYDRIKEVGSGWGYSMVDDTDAEELLSTLLVLVARSGFYLKEALETVSDRRHWAHATLVRIAPYSRGDVSDWILAELEPRWDEGPSLAESEKNWADAITSIVNQLCESRRVQAIQRAQCLSDAAARAKALSALGAATGKQSLIAEAKAAVRSILAPHLQVEAAEGICAFLPQSDLVGVINEVIDSAEAIRDYNRYVNALRRVLPWLPEPERAEAMKRILKKALPLTISRLRDLEPLGEYLLMLGIDDLKDFWREALDAAWPHERREILGSLRVFGYSLAALEGCEAVQEVVAALNDVSEWFP